MSNSYKGDRTATVELRCPVRPAQIGIRLFDGWGPQV